MQKLPALPSSLALAVATAVATAQEPAPAPTPTMVEIAAAYAAKITASALFVSGRSLDSVLAEELAPDRPLEAMIRPLLHFEVDTTSRRVVCTIGKARATAVATGNLGCTLVHATVPTATLQQRRAPRLADLRPDPNSQDWPMGDRLPSTPLPPTVDRTALDKAIDGAFAEPKSGPKVRTRAVVVVHKDRIVAERYEAGYRADMPLPGWSMTKSIVNALIGVLVQQGALDLETAFRAPEWSDDAKRRPVTWRHLLTMSAGLQWNESYDQPNSDVLQMLFRSADHAAVQARQPVAQEPGEHFQYSSGVTNLLCRGLRSTFASDLDYWAAPQARLFDRLGMRSAVIETDPSGTFVGSSYGFATARDWARLGLLYVHDGVWHGERVLPEGWVAATTKATVESHGKYGQHFWLNADPDGDGPRERARADLPADMLRMDGHEGQSVSVLPTQQIVVVRLGCTKAGGFDQHGLLRKVIAACGS